MTTAVERLRFSVEDYHRMVPAGILKEGDRVELIDGEVLKMAPIGPEHVYLHNSLTALLLRRLGERAWISAAGAFRLDKFSEPQTSWSSSRGASITAVSFRRLPMRWR